MNNELLEVRQDSLLSYGDGNVPPQALLRMGLMPLATKWDLLALQGRMFNLHQAAIGTAINGSAQAAGAIVLTAPTIRFSVPTGKTIFPYRFQYTLAAMAGTDNEVAMIYSQTDSYTSGGTAATPLNWRTDAPRATSVTSCYVAAGSAIVEAALTNVRSLYQSIYPLAAVWATSYHLDHTVDVVFKDLQPVIGPASFLIFLVGATTTPTFYFNLDWAEVPTVSAVTAV